MLFEYMKTTQGFLRDRSQKNLNPSALIRYINRARREIAMRSQCLRVVPPTSGSVEEIHVTASGSGYTNPTVVISAPDLPNGKLPYTNGAQATATAQQIGGQISNVSIGFGGSGYAMPTATITDPTGHGVVLTAQTSAISTFNPNQERYLFSDFPVSAEPGIKSVFAVLDVAIVYNNLRFVLIRKSFSDYQAFIRNYPFQFSYVPVVYCQLGDGTTGAILAYPFPSQQYPFEPDCLCIPSDLASDQDFEAIPGPWTEGVPYLAAYYAYLELQSFNNARFYLEFFERMTLRYSVYARPRMIVNPYGRA
jgi:hypothetical protein